MDITPRKRTYLSQHTSMTVRVIAAAVGVGKTSVSMIFNQQKNFGTVVSKMLEAKTTEITSSYNSGDQNTLLCMGLCNRHPNRVPTLLVRHRQQCLKCVMDHRHDIIEKRKEIAWFDES
ncbi:hypothetical protein TNCV_3643611 [Trichonephila clavipes]|nr:hypothetical protein TNCV_3643611 [Trichonephila clavipes]